MNFFDIEIDKKMYIKLLIICIVLVIIYLALTMSSLLIFKSYTLGQNTVVSNENMNTHIDVLENDGKKIEIAGWAYKEGEPIKSVNSNYVLKNQETGKMFLMRTQMEENINIKEEEHKLAGIHAQCLLFGIPKGNYDICVLYQNGNNDIFVDTQIDVNL